jgi:hypothetical protein
VRCKLFTVNFNARAFNIQRRYKLARRKVPREIAEAASHFQNARAEMFFGHFELPLEISLGVFHPLLVADGVFGIYSHIGPDARQQVRVGHGSL